MKYQVEAVTRWVVRDERGRAKFFDTKGEARDYAHHLNEGADREAAHEPRPGETGNLWLVNYRARGGTMDQLQILAETPDQALGLFLKRMPWAFSQLGNELSVEPYRQMAVKR